MFADSKTKGLNLEDTRIKLSKRLSLLIGICEAYFGLVADPEQGRFPSGHTPAPLIALARGRGVYSGGHLPSEGGLPPIQMKTLARPIRIIHPKRPIPV
jgi:hypothetical protein